MEPNSLGGVNEVYYAREGGLNDKENYVDNDKFPDGVITGAGILCPGDNTDNTDNTDNADNADNTNNTDNTRKCRDGEAQFEEA